MYWNSVLILEIGVECRNCCFITMSTKSTILLAVFLCPWYIGRLTHLFSILMTITPFIMAFRICMKFYLEKVWKLSEIMWYLITIVEIQFNPLNHNSFWSRCNIHFTIFVMPHDYVIKHLSSNKLRTKTYILDILDTQTVTKRDPFPHHFYFLDR